jgi:glutaredoxin
MNPIAKRLLEAYDELGQESLEFSALAERVTRSAKLDREAVCAALNELLRQGWLRPAGAADVYARTEDGRLALAGPRDVTLYTRPGCHLCDEAKAYIAPLLRQYGAALREVNIDADPALRERYTNDVPVLFLGSRKVAKHRVNLAQFRRQLSESAR